MSERVLVTGAGGFVGRHAAQALVDLGYEVHASHVEASPPLELPNVTWHRSDLQSRTDVHDLVERARPTTLLHLAWYAVHGQFWTSAENLQWVTASLELVKAFRELGGKRLVIAGTCAEYAWSTNDPLLENHSEIRPSTLYGVCKDALRRIVEQYLAGTDLTWAWGRLFFLYGPHEHPDRFVTHVARSLIRSETARCTHGRQVRDFLHVSDVGRALAALARSNVSGPVNVGSGEATSLAMVAETLQRIAGSGAVELGALPARADDPESIVADVRRLREEVGFRPNFSLEEGLTDLIGWLRADGVPR